MPKTLRALSPFALFFCIFLLVSPAMGHGFNRAPSGKAFFDIDSSKLSAESLPFVLGGIKVTFEEMEAGGISPDFIVIFRGLNTGILNSVNAGEQTQMLVSILAEMGVQLQVCSKAVYLSGENQDDLMPEFEVIENAWVSAILLQNKKHGDYAYVTF